MDGPLPQVFVLLLVLTSLPLVRTQMCGVGEDCGNGCTCVGSSNCNNVTRVCTCNAGLDGPTCNRRNVALGRHAVQSSLFREFPNDARFTAGNAVDGKVGHDLVGTPCTHTAQHTDPSWTVTLNSTYSIYRFQIYNRIGDCVTHTCGARLNSFTLSVGNSSSGPTRPRVCYQDRTTNNDGPGNIIDGVCDNSPIPGDTVRITLPRFGVLSLCEVKLLVCTSGTYGPLCTQTCGFCAGGRQVCDGTSGDCPDTDPRCLQQFAGPKCKDCAPGWYGETCQTCGFCADGRTVCDTTSGDCPDRSPTCMAGYTGTRCDTEAQLQPGRMKCCQNEAAHSWYHKKEENAAFSCSPGRYGQDCNQTCGFCYDGRTSCDSTSGQCPDKQPRCMAGYSGRKCDTECSDNMWGDDCGEPCGNCYNGTACNRMSGYCPVTQGRPVCMSGYIGNACSTRRNPLEETIQSAPNPAVIGGSVTGSLILVVIVVVVIIVFRRRRGKAEKSNTQEPDRREPEGVREEDHGVYENEIDMAPVDDYVNPYSIPDVNLNTDPVQHLYEAL